MMATVSSEERWAHARIEHDDKVGMNQSIISCVAMAASTGAAAGSVQPASRSLMSLSGSVVDAPSQYQRSFDKAGVVVDPPTVAQDLPANVDMLQSLKSDMEVRLGHLVRPSAGMKRRMKRHPHEPS